MYYLYLGRHGDFSSPEKLIIEYHEHYYYRAKHSLWFEMEEREINEMISGRNNKYYSIEKDQFEDILSSWGGSRHGYQTMNVDNIVDEEEF